jgi:hypothetical protein
MGEKTMKVAFSKDELEHLMVALEGYKLILDQMLESFNEDEPDLEPFSEEYKEGLDFLQNHKDELETNKRLCFRLDKKIREFE